LNKLVSTFLTFLFATNFAFSAEKKPQLLQNNKTSVKNPLELRDPFKREIRKKRRGKKNYPGTRSVFSNVPSIDATPLDKIKITGILIGKERRAVAKIIEDSGMSKESYILKEGMKLGENNAEIKAILPGGIVLVEKIRNVYDQDEYLETIIPVSSD
jgi:type IV pilus assembly protein PilP